ncbi:tyrosine-type recombinase/integrase [Thermoproteota archaeon]
MHKCPECKSSKTWRDGIRYVQGRRVQRYLCRSCGHRFSESIVKSNISSQTSELLHSSSDLTKQMVRGGQTTFKEGLDGSSLSCGEDIRPQISKPQYITTAGKDLNSLLHYSSDCRICAPETKVAKNLVKVKTRTEIAQREGTQDTKGKIIEYLWHMKKQGYAESTITRRIKLLKILSKRGGNLLDPESIKLVIAQQESWSQTTKEHAVTAYTSFIKIFNIEWNPPKYLRVRKLPFIPTEAEVKSLIYGCNKKTCAFLKLLEETGIRSGESWQLQWTDFNFENRIVTITPEKGSNPRALPISNELISMLKAFQNKSSKVFNGSIRHFRRNYRRQRKKVAQKLQNPRINHITFHTFRHFKATMEYHRTKDIIHVKQILGHKSINSTMLYTQLVNFKENDYHVKVANNVKEACEFVKSGFRYVTGEYTDGGKIFRKPK